LEPGNSYHYRDHYTSVPSNVDLRRNTVVGAESDANDAVIPLPTVSEEEERSGANLGRSVSLRSLGLNANVPRDVNSVRSSIQSFPNLAPQAVSTLQGYAVAQPSSHRDNDRKNGKTGKMARSH